MSRLYSVKFSGFLLLTALLSVNCIVQAQSIFSNLHASQFGDSVFVNWTLQGGATCVDMELQRSTDQVVFSEVYKVAGVCGGSQDQFYSFIDSEMLENGTTYYYRISATNDFFLSDTVYVLFVNAGEDEIFAYPNPTDQSMNITIDNSYTPPFLVQVFSSDGKQMYSSEMIYQNEFLFTKGLLPDGMYILKVTTNDRYVFSRSLLLTE